MTLPPNLRYERKFLADGFALAEVLAAIRRHPAAFRETYPARIVNNIYFDSPELRDYFDHVHGAADRIKTRMRWYGDLTGRIATPVLERKIKRGLVSGKAAHRLPALAVDGGLAPAALAAALDGAGLPENLRSALRHTAPVLVNRYLRRYYRSADGCFRLTADSDLQFFGLRPGAGAFTNVPSTSTAAIVELKFDPSQADQAAPITNALPFRLARCSKYVMGIERLLDTQSSV